MSSGTAQAVVVVTHKLDEVLDHADRITVLRQGSTREEIAVASGDAGAAERTGARRQERAHHLTRAIMGDAASDPDLAAEAASAQRASATETPRGAPLLALTRVHLGAALDDVSLAVRAGEIIGIAGVEGNGQRELVRRHRRSRRPRPRRGGHHGP